MTTMELRTIAVFPGVVQSKKIVAVSPADPNDGSRKLTLADGSDRVVNHLMNAVVGDYYCVPNDADPWVLPGSVFECEVTVSVPEGSTIGTPKPTPAPLPSTPSWTPTGSGATPAWEKPWKKHKRW